MALARRSTCPARRTCRTRRFVREKPGSATSDIRNRRSPCCGWRALRHRPPIAPPRSASFSRRLARRRFRGASAAVWSSVRDVLPFAAGGALGAWPVWRIVCPPASARWAKARDTGGDVIYDWGGGLIWAALPPKPDAQAALVRQRVNAVGGHATLLRASPRCAAMSMCSIPSRAALPP